jgi:hypothetical protein
MDMGRLAAWLSEAAGAPVVILTHARLSGGAIQQNIALSVTCGGVAETWVLRTDNAATLAVSLGRGAEFALLQAAHAAAGIWLPRDAYLQERFCRPVAVRVGETHLLEPGDLVFFGTPRRCTHVGLHLGGGRYLHSSGRDHGRNGIGIDDLNPRNSDPVASHYRAELRGAGRVMHSHDGSPLPP